MSETYCIPASTTDVPFSGATVYYSAAVVKDRVALATIVEGVNSAWKNLIPDLTDWPEAVKRALTSLYAGRRCMIRPLGKGTGYAVVKEEVSDSSLDLSWDQDFNVLLYPAGCGGGVMPHGIPTIQYQEVVAESNKFRNAILPGAISNMLSQIVRSLGGVVLRSGGGVFWLPKASLNTWQKLAAGLAHLGIKCYTQRTMIDEDATASVLDAIRTDVAKALVGMKKNLEEIASDPKKKLTDKMLAARRAEIKALVLRMSQYQADLGTMAQDALDAAAHADQVLGALSQADVHDCVDTIAGIGEAIADALGEDDLAAI